MSSQSRSQAQTAKSRSLVTAIDPVLVLLVAIVLSMAIFEPRFFSRLNMINICRNGALLTLVAIGQTVVMIVGGLDLSVGSVMALSSVVTAMSMVYLSSSFDPVTVGLLGAFAGLGSGLVVGILNASIVLGLRISPFMATLGMASAIGGAALFLTKGVPVYGLTDSFILLLAKTTMLGVPLMVWIVAVLAFLIWLVLERTPFGRHIYAVGGKVQAARASGVNTAKPVFFAYCSAAVFAALAGILVTARIGSGQAIIGSTSAIEAIAAAVVGGVSLRGGAGKIWRVVVAAAFLSVVANVLNLIRIDSKWQTLVLGVAVLVAALVELRTRKGTVA